MLEQILSRTSHSRDDDDKFDKPNINHLNFPSFSGQVSEYYNYKYEVMNLKAQCAAKDHKYLAPKLIANFKGSLLADCRQLELDMAQFKVSDGIEKLMDWI